MAASTQTHWSLASVAKDHAAARQDYEQERRRLRRAVLQALADGMSEQQTATVAGISRTTVRAWRGRP